MAAVSSAVCPPAKAYLHRCLQQHGQRPGPKRPDTCCTAMLPVCPADQPQSGAFRWIDRICNTRQYCWKECPFLRACLLAYGIASHHAIHDVASSVDIRRPPRLTARTGRWTCTTTWGTSGGRRGSLGGRRPSAATRRRCAWSRRMRQPGEAWETCSGRTGTTTTRWPATR